MNKKAILHYLNYTGEIDERMNQLLDECIAEVQKLAHFKVTTQKFSLQHHPLTIVELHLELHSNDLEEVFSMCDECLVIACTLGVMIDRQIKYYEHINMTKAVIFDAVSSRYLEECCDEYEKLLNLGVRTFRFAPGYGDLPLELNRQLASVLQVDRKLGVSMNKGGLFVPMKSMLGIIGIGQAREKSCLTCLRRESCILRKGGQRCYVND